MYQTVGIKVVTPPFDVNTRASSLSGPVDDPDLVESIALDLLTEFDDDPVRKLGVRVSKLSFGTQDQARLDGFEGEPTAEGEGADDGDDGMGGGWASTADIAHTAVEGDARLTDWVDGDSDEPAVDADDAGDTGDDGDPEGQSSLGAFD